MRLGLGVVALLLAGCTLGANAVNAPLKDFTSDGCSLFPDGDFKDRTLWCDCCLEHDVAYWRGGTAEERLAADEQLRRCVYDKTHNEALADMMFAGVRLGGGPVFPTWYRWGYGWNYGRSYKPLDERERRLADSKLSEYRASGKRFACERAK